MGIEAEDILVCVWRLLHFPIRTCSFIMQKHPFVSASLLSLFLLYAFFDLFVFFSPFLVCVALLVRVFWTSGGLKILESKRGEKRKLDPKVSRSIGGNVVVGRDVSSSLQKQKSRRTNVRRKECDPQIEKEKKEASILITGSQDLITTLALLDKEAKLLKLEGKERAFDHGKCSNAKVSSHDNIQILDEHHSILDTDRDILSSGSSEEEEETVKFDCGGIKNEGSMEGGNKAVQWNDDDQRNLMDLGLSEIERNKRLESLIARRRARKLFKMQIEKGLIDLDTILPGQIAPLYVTKNNPFIAEMDGMQTPGSAPSIMFPTKNPFDLPYDPLEEKPDLMADSFQQEFTAATQKDMLYCRHESFCFGAAFPLEPKRRATDELGFSRFRDRSEIVGPHDKRIERMLSNKGEHDELVETLLADEENESISRIESISEVVDSEATTPNPATKSGKSKDAGCRVTRGPFDVEGMAKTINDQNMDVMSTKSEMEPHETDDSNDESTSSVMSEEDEQTFTGNRSGEHTQNAVVTKARHVPPKCSIPSPSTERSRLEERLFYPERPCHTPTHSIASDMQVECSEVGSPPLTVDGANSPTDRESLNLDGDFEREYMWAVSSQSSRAEESESRPRDMRGLSEKDFAGMVFSGHNRNTKDIAESSMVSLHEYELDDTFSLSSAEIQGERQAHSISFDEKAFDDVRKVVEEVGKPSTSGLSSAVPENKVDQLKSSEKLVAQPKESSNPPNESTKKVNVPAAKTISDLTDEKKDKDRDDEAKTLVTPELDGRMPKPSEVTVGESSRNVEEKSVNPAVQQIKDNKNISPSEGDLLNVTEKQSSKDIVEPIDAKKSSNTNKDGKAGHSNAENGVSDVKQISTNPSISVMQQNLVIQEALTNSTSSPSSKSVLLENVQTDQVTSSISIPKQHKDSPEEKPHDSSPTMLQNGKHLVKKSTSHSSNTSNYKRSQEESKPLEKSTEEANIVLAKSAEEITISQKEREAAAKLKTQTQEVESASQKATEAHADMEKSTEENGNASQKEKEGTNLKNSPEAFVESKKSDEETASVSQKAAEGLPKLLNPVEESRSLTKKEKDGLPELKKTFEETGSVIQKAKEATDLKNPIEVHVELRNSEKEIASVSPKPAGGLPELKNTAEESRSITQKEKEDLPELKKTVKESGNVTQIETEAHADVKKSVQENASGSLNETNAAGESQKPAEDIDSVSQTASEDPTEVEKPSKEIASVSEKATEAPAESKKIVEEIGSLPQKATEDATELTKKVKETASVSQNAAETSTEMKKQDGKFENQSQKALESTVEIKNPAVEIGKVSQKAPDPTAALKKPAEVVGSVSHQDIEAPEDMKKAVESIGNVTQKASEVVAEVKNPAEKSKNVPEKEIEVASMLKNPAEGIGNASTKATEVAAEIKKTTEEIKHVAEKAKEIATELKKSADDTDNVSTTTIDALRDLKKTVDETGSVSCKKPSEETGNVSHKPTDPLAEKEIPAEETKT